MALATQCPHCYTSFRVANDQLKLYAGMVRCGACKQTFNGIEHLIPPGSTPKLPPAPEQADTASVPAPEEINASAHNEPQPLPASVEADQRSNANPDDRENDELDLESNLRELLQEIKSRQLEDDSTADETIEQTALSHENDLPAGVSPVEDHIAEDAASHLEIIETEDEPQPAVVNKLAPKGLTASIDFDLDEGSTYTAPTIPPIKQPLDESDIEEIRSLETAIESELDLYDDGHDHEEITSPAITPDAVSARGLLRNAPRDSRESDAKAETSVQATQSSDARHDADKEETPNFVLRAQREQRYGKWTRVALSLGVLIGLFAAIAQSTYFFRNAIAAEYPQVKPHLLKLCQLAKCEIKLPAQRSQLEISGSELQILTNEPLVNELNFQIQNKGKSAQTWPHLELILKDIRGKTILQKVIAPTIYLDNKAQLATGIPGNSESAHKLNFELAIPKASSYAVELFYP